MRETAASTRPTTAPERRVGDTIRHMMDTRRWTSHTGGMTDGRASGGAETPRLGGIEPFDVVRLPAGMSEHGVPVDAEGVVLEVYRRPRLAYEVEIADGDGRTAFQGAVEPDQVELVHRARPTPD